LPAIMNTHLEKTDPYPFERRAHVRGQAASREMDPITVMLVDDHPMVRAGLQAMLGNDPHLRVVGEAANGREALDRVPGLLPAVVLMDSSMPALDGVEATRLLKADYPETAVIMMMDRDDLEIPMHAMRAGASGYLLKDAPRLLIVHAICIVAHGGVLVGGPLLHEAVRRLPAARSLQRVQAGSIEPLTAREQTVLQHLASGKTNRQIGEALGYAEVTVKKYVQTIIAKLQASDRTHAAIMALRYGFIS
jgi:DNA-binding NarL/FixJ family response regulator